MPITDDIFLPVESQVLSPGLKDYLRKLGIESLTVLLNLEVYKWHQLPGFTYHFQYEIVSFIVENGLWMLMEDD
jgi:hypothetical protein